MPEFVKRIADNMSGFYSGLGSLVVPAAALVLAPTVQHSLANAPYIADGDWIKPVVYATGTIIVMGGSILGGIVGYNLERIPEIQLESRITKEENYRSE